MAHNIEHSKTSAGFKTLLPQGVVVAQDKLGPPGSLGDAFKTLPLTCQGLMFSACDLATNAYQVSVKCHQNIYNERI